MNEAAPARSPLHLVSFVRHPLRSGGYVPAVRCARSGESSLEAVQAQHQCHGVQWRFLKAVVLIKRFSRLVQRMNQQGAHTSVLRYGDGTTDSNQILRFLGLLKGVSGRPKSMPYLPHFG